MFIGNFYDVKDNIAKVGWIINDESLLTPEILSQGVLIDEIPEPEVIQGMAPVRCYNLLTKEMLYQYEPIPLTTDERIDLMQQAIDDLAMGGI